MAVNVLYVLRLGAVNVARQVQVVSVLRVGDLINGDHACVAPIRAVHAGEGVHDAVNVLLAQTVLVAVLDEALAGINHKDALAGGSVFLVEHEDARRDARAVEQIGRQADDALQIAGADELFTDHRLGVAAEQDAVRQDAGGFALTFHRADDVQQVGVIALLARAARPRRSAGMGLSSGIMPVLQVLSENGGLATT